MRAYKVVAKQDDEVLGTRFAATQALARETRDELMAKFDVKKSAVEIEETEVPMAKPDLLVFINELSEKNDAVEEGDE